MDWTHRLRLRHLQVLLSLSRTGNLTQSATALSTTQPALSKWLRELEDDVGLPLFERHARGLRPTVYGAALIEHSRRIEGYLDTTRDDMQAMRDGGSGLVAVGTSGVAAADTVPLAVARLLDKMPRAHVRLVESTMDQLVPQLARGELDIVVGRSDQLIDHLKLCVEKLYEEQINFIARPQHPLFSRDRLSWDDILECTWIVWPQGTPIRNAVQAALTAAGKSLPAHFVESNSSLLNLTLLNNSNLIGVASHRAASRFVDLKAIRILNIQLKGYGSVSMYWNASTYARAAVQLTLDSLRESARLTVEGWSAE